MILVSPGSIDAIQGAIGTVCEAVDRVISTTRSTENQEALHRVFIAIRPPGHHCGEDTPSGFCFVNNVAIGAAHGKVMTEFL
jgi:histone deacetylase HOS3